MTGKAQAARQPSIDELLVSIRRAIHERVAPGGPGTPAAQARTPSLVHTTPPPRTAPGQPETASERGRLKRTIVTAGEEGFAGLLGGDVRLEEALARLDQTGWSRGAEPPAAAEAARAEPQLRPTIDDQSGGRASPPAAPAAAAPAWRASMHTRQSAAPRPAEQAAHASAGVKTDDLLSSEAASAAHSAFSRLADAVVSRSTGGEPSLEEMTRDCLRPLLKDWLDKNLPGLVERLVREEIERVARPGR